MEFLKVVKRRSFLNEVIYIALNVALAVGLMLLIRTTGSVYPAFGLVLISKWRIFAVRPRFWFANIQTNMVSFIVSVSYVTFLYTTSLTSMSESQILILQSILAIFDIAWLVLLKPQSKRIYVVLQAGVALFVGVTALSSVSYGWMSSPVVLLTWLIGYAVSRHVLNNYDDESHTLFLSLAWGLVLAEIGWLAYHWTIAYQLPIFNKILLPQVSIIALCFGFLTFKAYDSYYHHQKIRLVDIILPLIFTVSVVAMLLVAFNNVTTGV
ncbi:MAG: hypothetical protein WCH58_01580 [Candidatus Saccharibacteria bacterium]